MARKLPPRLFLRPDTGTYRCKVKVYDANGRRARSASGAVAWRYVDLGRDLKAAIEIQRELDRDAEYERRGLGVVVRQDRAIADVVAAYLRDLEARVSPAHHRNVTSELTLLQARLRVQRVAELVPSVVEQVRRDWLAEGLAVRTVNKRVGALQAALAWAERTGLIGASRIGGIEPIPGRGREVHNRRHLSPDEMRRLLLAAHADDADTGEAANWNRVPQAPMFHLIGGSGFRLREATRLRWRLTRLGENPEIGIEKRGGKNPETTWTPIGDDLAETLRRVHEGQGAFLGRLPTPDDFVLLSPRGKPWGERSTRHLDVLNRALQRAGLQKRASDGTVVDWHALRGTYGQILLESGVDLWVVSSLLRHKDVKTTQRAYVKVEQAMSPRRAAARALPNFEPPRRDADDATA